MTSQVGSLSKFEKHELIEIMMCVNIERLNQRNLLANQEEPQRITKFNIERLTKLMEKLQGVYDSIE